MYIYIYIFIIIQSALNLLLSLLLGFTIPFPSNTKRKEVVNYQLFFLRFQIEIIRNSWGINQHYIDEGGSPRVSLRSDNRNRKKKVCRNWWKQTNNSFKLDLHRIHDLSFVISIFFVCFVFF